MSYNKELKPGIQALVIGSVRDSRNIGKTVTLKKVTTGVLEDGSRVDCWEVEGENLHWHMRSRVGGGVSKSGIGNRSWFLSQHLMPIYPEADPLSLEIKEKENV